MESENETGTIIGQVISLPVKKKYEKPKLEILGNIRGNTLGGSKGLGDSQAPKAKRP